MRTPDQQERLTLINRLVKVYPYPREWFETLSTSQLVAMYNQPKRNAARLATKKIPEADHKREGKAFIKNAEGKWEEVNIRMDNPDDVGQSLINTDGHGWEKEY